MAVFYPNTLPAPSSYRMVPAQQLSFTAEEEYGPREFRNITRYPGASASVTFQFLNDDYKVFKTWWVTQLLYGHRWFVINLPSAGGMAAHRVRFATKYSASKRGYRHIEVTVELEIRERLFAPPVPEVFTSLPYPTVIEESLNITHAILSAKFLSILTEESINISHSILSGILLQPLKTYSDWPDESLNISHGVLSGNLITVLIEYNLWPQESVDISHAILSGSLVQVLVDYNNWPDESVNISHSIISGILS